MWLSNVDRVEGNSAGEMNGDGSRKILLHSTEGSTIDGAIAAYRANNSWPHLTVDCRWRRAVQHLSLTVAARSLRNEKGGVETNKDGTYLVQIELVGSATNPFTIGQYEDLDWLGREIIAPIAERCGVPLTTGVTWLPYPASYGPSPVRLSPTQWDAYSGILGHQHAPENTHGDPGLIDIDRILAAARGEQEDDLPYDREDLINNIVREAIAREFENPDTRTALAVKDRLVRVGLAEEIEQPTTRTRVALDAAIREVVGEVLDEKLGGPEPTPEPPAG